MLVRIQIFFTALTLGFGLLHFILFVFLPRQRSNLYYALFLLVYRVLGFDRFSQFGQFLLDDCFDTALCQDLLSSLIEDLWGR